MIYPVLTAAMLVEANGAALNNAGNAAGQRLDNAVVVKQIQVGRNSYPYISGQAIRRWWREVLYADFGWEPSPVTREAKSAYTQGDPIRYADDDVFGYMAAKKAPRRRGRRAEEEASESSLAEGGTAQVEESAEAGGTQRRVSPLKNSLLVSVLPNVITSDFGHFSRDLPVENPNMVPFEHEHYTALMQGVFTLSLTDVGRFECGPMRDLPTGTPTEGVTVVREMDGASRPKVLALPFETRRERVAQAVEALAHLRYGANLTRNLSDVVPAVILLGFLDGGNAPFQNLFAPGENGTVVLNLTRLESVLTDYRDRLLAGGRLFFGYRPGILGNEAEVLERLRSGVAGVSFMVGTPGQAIREIARMARESGVVPERLG
ncbi:MAG TPA: type I-B CRISPR-associated protein Cas7/Cst2/DevR [Chthonomonadaceae bacterium]|nr:type I-B CRISPR-associated protein Cas7/Cst2/DevR [Chthonomonadaceae bacterium]